MPSLDDLLKIFFFVPLPLRRALALGAVVVLGLAALVDLNQDSGPWESFWNPICLGATALWSTGLIIVAIARHKALRVSWTIFWSLAFLGIATAAAIRAKTLHAYIYNEVGFNQSRSWVKATNQPEDPSLQLWEWHMNAVKDLSQMPIVVELRQTEPCQFISFWPTSDTEEYRPPITDQSEAPGGTARWLVRGLRKPAQVTFNLKIKENQAGLPPACTLQISAGNTP